MRIQGAALCVLLVFLGCGKRGDPQAPLSRTPQPVTDLRIEQRGRELVYTLVAPRVTAAGVGLPVLEIQLDRAQGEGEFPRLARKDRRRAAPGETIREAMPLPALGTLVRATAQAIADGRSSAVTTLVSLRVEPVPVAPTELKATLVADLVALAWKGTLPPLPAPPPSPVPSPPATAPSAPSPPATASAPSPVPAASAGPASPPAAIPPASPAASGPPALASPAPSPSPTPPPPPPPQRGFWVYRRAPTESYTAPLRDTPEAANAYSDRDVQLGQSFCYVVRMVVSTAPLVESESSPEACVTLKDVAAPAVPSGVATLTLAEHIDVSWSPSPEADLARYRIYRSSGGTPPERIGEVAAGETLFKDLKPGRGGAHFYTVTAVDGAGNESPPSTPAEGHLP